MDSTAQTVVAVITGSIAAASFLANLVPVTFAIGPLKLGQFLHWVALNFNVQHPAA